MTEPAIPTIAKTWMPTASGVLSIVSGVFSLIGALFLLWGIIADWSPGDPQVEAFMFITVWLFTTGLLALIGGMFALKRRNWALALAGSIAAIFGGGTVLGIVAIIFLAMSRKEFSY